MVMRFQFSGDVGSAEQERQYESYYAAIADRSDARSGGRVSVYKLRPEIGTGSIEVTRLHGGLKAIRYDVTFVDHHRMDYRFSEDRFELETCLEGGVRIVERRAGGGDLGRLSSSLTPPRPTEGVLVHPAGQPYRGVSVTGRRGALAPYLGSLGEDDFGRSLDRLDAAQGDDLYLGRGPRLRGSARVLAEMFDVRATSAGKALRMESLAMAAFGSLVDAASLDDETHGLAAHELEALRSVPLILWSERHDLPTLHEVARRVSMSPKRLAQGFRRVFDTTPMDYHRTKCMERASDLLLETDWTVERIGSEVGYAAVSNFVYAFRRRQGCTPAEYRRTQGAMPSAAA